MAEQALTGLKILDLTGHIAGPYCTRLLAGLGAEVIKIERPDRGDPARMMGPFPGDDPDPEKSGLFLYLNAAKKGVTLNLKSDTGKKILKELVSGINVLVENFEPRVMPSLGLDYETLKEINPGLVMTSISNFGQTGPYRDNKAQEINLVALGGLMYMTGDPVREPLKEPGATAQFTAGANASAATLAATYEQKQSGTGQHVDISIMESVISLLDITTLMWNRSQLTVKRKGNYAQYSNLPGGLAGAGIYPCKDGHIGINIRHADDLALVSALTGEEELNDPEMGTASGKYVHRDRLNSLLLEAFQDRKKGELFRSAQELRLLWGEVRNIEEVRNSDHYQERGFWVEIDHPRAGRLTYSRLPLIMSETVTVTGRAPLLGEHNEEVYGDRLDYSTEELAKLKETGIV